MYVLFLKAVNVVTLRLSVADLLTGPRIRFKCAEAAFSYCGPVIWKKLLADLRSSTTVFTFKSKLQSFLFSQANNK